MKFLFDLTTDEQKKWFFTTAQSENYRFRQFRKWLFQPGVTSFESMSNLPRSLRKMLAETFTLRTMQVLAKSGEETESAEKFLLQLADGNRIETVLLHNDSGEHSVCVSTQVGCAMRCAFCASGMDGMLRNLTAGEILEQFLLVADYLKEREKKTHREERLSHAVIMGMGEPTANANALLQALEQVSSADGMGMSARKMTISTVGIPGGIAKIANCDKPYHLAVSLHAPNDALRSQIIPANRHFGIRQILHDADDYFEKTGRRVTYEYILLAGINDQSQHASELAQLLRNRNAMVNLIPCNPVPGKPFHPPSEKQIQRFVQILQNHGINVVLRHRKGDKIQAACGQLRAAHRSTKTFPTS
ncbi:MAG: 23S rRNA (adenine(2503)-C(2))-methyltransferase RlmN [Planctomycetia bacterium]|nr:23S rRNA (adenine(2503)-C(2))-methyltransferase RlmN [Planctomycetia bacterium]